MTWPTAPLKRVAEINRAALSEDTDPDRVIQYIDISAVGRGRLVSDPQSMRFGDAPSRARRLVAPGDTIVSTVRTYLRAVVTVCESTDDLVVSTGFAVVSPGEGMDPGFLSWYLQSDTFVEEVVGRSNGVSYPAIAASDMGRIHVRLPSWAEQRVIADFLDTETARIDALITKKRRMIELLEQREVALVEERVQALRSDQPSRRLKYLVSEVDERLGDDDAPELLSVSIHLGVVPRAAMTDDPPRADDLASYKWCLLGDIALNRMRAFQGGVGVAGQAGIVSPDYIVLRVGPRVMPEFLHHVFRSRWFVGEMTRRLRGIGSTDQGNVRTPRINWGELGSIEIPVPSTTQQRRVSIGLEDAMTKSRVVVGRISIQLQRMKEHRQALITAAVTGELDIARTIVEEVS